MREIRPTRVCATVLGREVEPMDEVLMDERLEEVEDDLASRAFLYDNPTVYREAVDAAMLAVRAMLERARAVA
jgi:hypothetical protein